MKYVLLVGLIGGVLYLPIRREILDRGWVIAGCFQSQRSGKLALWDTGRYELAGKSGKYTIEQYPDAPWISLIQLDTGLRLHVPYEDRVYRVEDISDMSSADDKFVRR